MSIQGKNDLAKALYSLRPFNMFEKKKTINPLSANFTKWSNTLKQFVDNLD